MKDRYFCLLTRFAIERLGLPPDVDRSVVVTKSSDGDLFLTATEGGPCWVPVPHVGFLEGGVLISVQSALRAASRVN